MASYYVCFVELNCRCVDDVSMITIDSWKKVSADIGDTYTGEFPTYRYLNVNLIMISHHTMSAARRRASKVGIGIGSTKLLPQKDGTNRRSKVDVMVYLAIVFSMQIRSWSKVLRDFMLAFLSLLADYIGCNAESLKYNRQNCIAD
jgi:hypothetical protein